MCPCRILSDTFKWFGLAPEITAAAVEFVLKKAVWALGGSAVGPGRTGTMRLRRSGDILHQCRIWVRFPYGVNGNRLLMWGLFHWGLVKARLAMVKLGLAAGNRTSVDDN